MFVNRRFFLMSFAFLFFITLIYTPVFAYSLWVSTDKIVYEVGDTLNLEGTVDAPVPANITASIYNSSGSLMNASVTESSGATPNAFSLSSEINSNYSSGEYFIIITDGAASVNLSFKVVLNMVLFEPHLTGHSQIVEISTSGEVTDNSDENYGELVNLSLSGKVRNGSANLDGKEYYFVLVDQNQNGSFDTLYIDDDNVFQLYNSTEDEDAGDELERVRTAGEGVRLNNTEFIVGYIEFPTGSKVLLGRPVDNMIYSPNETVNFTVLARNSTGHLLSGQSLNVRLLNPEGVEINSTAGTTDGFGVFTGNFTAPPQAGAYIIDVNGRMGIEFFSVEVFSIMGKITDLAGNPAHAFSENPEVRITTVLKDAAGFPVETATVSAMVAFPQGDVQTYTLAGGNGTWSYDLDLENAPAGKYGVKIVAAVSGDTQEFSTGFAIESTMLEVMPVNVDFIDESEGPEAFVNAFAPNKNVTLLVMLSNVSAGGMFAKGPGGTGMIGIDNSSTSLDECASRVVLENLEDDRGVSLLSSLNYTVMNMSNFVESFGLPEDEGPPPEMMSQCMVVFSAPNRTGVYRAGVKVSHPTGDVVSGASFGVQRVFASANPVDFKGDDFWFYAPNSSIRIKIKVIDMETQQDVSSANIVDATILEMYKEWPGFEDMMDSGYRPNEDVVNGTLNFTTPDSEGFFRFVFRFKIDLNGTIEESVGTGFFMLKKYFIWGEPACEASFGPCIFASGQDITMAVNVVDISQGALFDKGTDLTCTNCDGLEADVERLENHQVFKEMVEGTDYTVKKGSVMNGVANISIIVNSSKPLPSGWYGVDLILTDPANPSNQYFGWAGFEVRNLWVETIPVFMENGTLMASWDRKTYPMNEPVAFAVIARDPKNPDTMLPIQSIDVKSVKWLNSWPPLDTPFTHTKSKETIVFEFGPGGKEPVSDIWVVNITSGVKKQGEYQVNVKVSTDKGSDVGSLWFNAQSYFLDVYYRGIDAWPPVYASDENLTINITGLNFDFSPHNLTDEGTRLRSLWDIKSGRPLKINSSTQCSGDFCTITANLSSLDSGEYDASLTVKDDAGNEIEEHLYFVIRSMVTGVPSIDEAWIGYMDTPERELNVDNEGDPCDNERGLQEDAYTSQEHAVDRERDRHLENDNETCSNDTTISIWCKGGCMNFTVSQKYENNTAVFYCILTNGSWTGPEGGSCPANSNTTYIVSNTTNLWIKIEDNSPIHPVDMTSAMNKTVGDNFTAGNRTWFIRNIGERDMCDGGGCYLVGDANKIIVSADDFVERGIANNFNCSDDTMYRFNVSSAYAQNFVNVQCILYESVEGVADYCDEGMPQNPQLAQPYTWVTGKCPDGVNGNTVYIVSNTTHVWVNTSPDLTSTQGLSDGDSFTIGGREWKILDVGKHEDGEPYNYTFRAVIADRIKINEDTELNVSDKYEDNYANRFYVREERDWDACWGGDCGEGEIVYVVSNTTHLWVSASADLTGSIALATDDEFEVNGTTWKVASVDEDEFRVKRADGICGEMDVCTDGDCDRVQYTLTPPDNSENFTKVYHGHVRNLVEELEHDNEWFIEEFGQDFNVSRPVCIYHNTTHVWMSNTTDFTGKQPAGVGSTLTDSYGGTWEVENINKNNVVLLGQNVLARSGAWINTSLSKSGIIKITAAWEDELGGWDPIGDGWRGVDLDGNGDTNDTVYFAIIDSASPGIYDTFFFSTTNNLSMYSPQGIGLGGTQEARTFGLSDNLTLLGIPPDGNRARLYSDRTGDWADLGELKLGDNIRIPVIVRSPSGDPETANVSVRTIKRETGTGAPEIIQLQMPYPNVTDCYGLCEITVNVSALTPPQTESGRYSFEIVADKSGTEERPEEWKWPNVMLRKFLLETSAGEGGYIGEFTELPVYRYDWENYGEIIRLRSDRQNETNPVDGMLTWAHPFDFWGEGCKVSNSTGEWVLAGDINQSETPYLIETESGDNRYYFYNYSTGVLYENTSGCVFNLTTATSYSLGDYLTIPVHGKDYNVSIIRIDRYAFGECGPDDCWRASFGVPGIDASVIPPMRNDTQNTEWGMEWGYLTNLTIGGESYDVVLGGDTCEYPMCSIWDMQECAKKAWFSTQNNFSQDKAVGVRIGENFTDEMYLAKIGPGPWEGIVIANLTQLPALPQLPGLDIRVRDNTPARFAVLDENVLNLDLNKDGQMNRTFYMVAFDDKDNGQQTLTHNIIDDDLNITEDWWQNFSADESEPGKYKDFYSNEAREREFREPMPIGWWYGGARFAENEEEISWEDEPRWDILNFNDTHALFKKEKWKFSSSENITFIIKAYNFDQTPVTDANVSLLYMLQFTPFGGSYINITAPGAPEVVSVQNITDSSGFAILRLENSTWGYGEYMAVMRVKTATGEEIAYNWFKVE